MIKNFKLHYIFTDAFNPDNNDRDYICFSLLSPHSDKFKTLAIDERVLNSILKRCKDDNHINSMIDNIHSKILSKIQNGIYKGYIIVAC